MMRVSCYVQILSPRWFVCLDEFVTGHFVVEGVEVFEIFWGTHFAGVEKGVCCDVVVFFELGFEVWWEVREGGSGVGEEG